MRFGIWILLQIEFQRAFFDLFPCGSPETQRQRITEYRHPPNESVIRQRRRNRHFCRLRENQEGGHRRSQGSLRFGLVQEGATLRRSPWSAVVHPVG